MAMFQLPTADNQQLSADNTELTTIGPPSFPGAIAFPVEDKKVKVNIEWPTINPKTSRPLPRKQLSQKQKKFTKNNDSNDDSKTKQEQVPKDLPPFPILSLTVTNLEKPKKTPVEDSDAKFAEDLPAMMIKQLISMKPTGSLQFIPDHMHQSSGMLTESVWSDDRGDIDQLDDDNHDTRTQIHHDDHPQQYQQQYHHPQQQPQQYHNPQQQQQQYHNPQQQHQQYHNPQQQQHQQYRPQQQNQQYHHQQPPHQQQYHQPYHEQQQQTHVHNDTHKIPKDKPSKPTKMPKKTARVRSVSSEFAHNANGEHLEFQHDIHDILNMSLKDKYIYMVLDHCVGVILEAWPAIVIANKTASDVEDELLLYAGGLYETLLDYFYNSSTEISSAIHQICCKIHVMRLLLEGTKMIHIPSNLEEFEKTFGGLTSIKISTILGTNTKAKLKKGMSHKRVRIQSISKRRTQSISKRKNNVKLAPISTSLDPNALPGGSPKYNYQKSRTVENKLQSINSMTSIKTAFHITRETMAKKLRNALKELIFQNKKTYMAYWENKLFLEQKEMNVIQEKNHHKPFPFADSPVPSTPNARFAKLLPPKGMGTPISPVTRSVTKIFNIGKTENTGGPHTQVQCEGCGQMMDMNDGELQASVITYDLPSTHVTFFFHDKICVILRKYKEIIRKYVSESKLPAHKKSKNLPQYIKNLMSNFNSLIGIHGHETLSRPHNPYYKKKSKDFKASTSTLKTSRLQRGMTSTKNNFYQFNDEDSDNEEDESQGYADESTGLVELTEHEMMQLRAIQREREIACRALFRDSNEKVRRDGNVWEFDSIPLSIQICDINRYGVVLWSFVMQQLLTKQMESLWLLLAYFSSELPTKIGIDLLQQHLADLAKVKNMENLELVCSAILANAAYPIATALHLSHFIDSVADNDLSRKKEFRHIADKYTLIAEKLVESVESDHLLSLFLEAPTNLNMMSVFEIAINYEMEDFFDNNRVGRIMDHMWSQFDFLNPALNYRTQDIDLYEMLMFLLYHPAQFYYTPVGRYWINSLMYIGYVILITSVAEEGSYLYSPVTQLESVMWIYNCGYILYELMEMTFRGIEYFSDKTNYFDMGIMLGWSILGVMRFGIDNSKHENVDTATDARNSRTTLIYMTIFGIQICVLYCRIATIFIRSKTLGPFIRMIGEMLDDVLNFAFVSLIFFLGFTVALRYILASDMTEECGSESNVSTPYTVSLFVFITLMGQNEWNVIVANECFNEKRAIAAQIFIVVFTILGTMLLINLLIAMMATTYNEKLESKSKEVNYYRTEEIYQLAHEQAIISPPFNIFVFIIFIIWYLIEFIINICNYMINIGAITPVHINYTDTQVTQTTFFIKYTDENNNFAKKYCQFCRIYMEENGNISDYLHLFKGYRLDKDDVKVIKNMFHGQGLCPKCFRPYKVYADGSSNRLARWQVIIEIISFYAFIIFVYVPMLLVLTIPALFVGFWAFIQELAHSNVEKRMTGESDIYEKPRGLGLNYRQLIRSIIQHETTDDWTKINMRVDEIMNEIKDIKTSKTNNRNPNETSAQYSKQFNQLTLMIAQVNSRLDTITNQINDMNVNKPAPLQHSPKVPRRMLPI